jgi:hypothetical protein
MKRLTADCQIALAHLIDHAVQHRALRRPFDSQEEDLGELIHVDVSLERPSRSKVSSNAVFPRPRLVYGDRGSYDIP